MAVRRTALSWVRGDPAEHLEQHGGVFGIDAVFYTRIHCPFFNSLFSKTSLLFRDLAKVTM